MLRMCHPSGRLFVMLALALAGCAGPPRLAAVSLPPAQEVDVVAAYAVFDDLLGEMERDPSLRQFCIGIAENPADTPADPPAPLLRALAARHAAVQPASACTLVRRGSLTVLADGSILLLYGALPVPGDIAAEIKADPVVAGAVAGMMRSLAFGGFRRSDCLGPLSDFRLYHLGGQDGRAVVRGYRHIDSVVCETAENRED